MRNRVANELIARKGNYFWLPCPLCGQMFGGHEWMIGQSEYIATIPSKDDPESLSEGICPDCTLAGKGYRYTPPEAKTAHVRVQIYTDEVDTKGHKWRARVYVDGELIGEDLDRTEKGAIAQARRFSDMKIKAMREAAKPKPEPRLAVDEHVEL